MTLSHHHWQFALPRNDNGVVVLYVMSAVLSSWPFVWEWFLIKGKLWK